MTKDNLLRDMKVNSKK